MKICVFTVFGGVFSLYLNNIFMWYPGKKTASLANMFDHVHFWQQLCILHLFWEFFAKNERVWTCSNSSLFVRSFIQVLEFEQTNKQFVSLPFLVPPSIFNAELVRYHNLWVFRKKWRCFVICVSNLFPLAWYRLYILT